MADFKVPEIVPQDLLLIQEMVDVPPPLPRNNVQNTDAESSSDSDISSSDDSSSDSDADGANSEDEIEANLVPDDNEDSDPSAEKPHPADSDEDLSSDSEEEDDLKAPIDAMTLDGGADDEDEDAPSAGAGTIPTTRHEVVETEIAIPDLDQLDPSEQVEKVGEIMSIVDQVAIVRGIPSDTMNRGAQKALDSDTLLVFDDRSVMGYIYETFGPTTQPFYQVRYNSKYPLNPERVKVSREVFAAPSKSKFVFVDQIKAFKGSDASNVYDEEPADDEIEFSDDEAEAAHKSRMKRKRGESRARSIASSREPTPNPSHMRDHELMEDAILSRNPYDEHSPYDLDFSAPGPSRPAPIPYDDPYATPAEAADDGPPAPMPQRPPARPPVRDARPRGRGRGGNFGQNSRGRGRGGFSHETRRGSSLHTGNARNSDQLYGSVDPYTPQAPSQTQDGNSGYYQQDYQVASQQSLPGWGFPPMMQAPFGAQNAGVPFVQPHINPLFAPSFGFPFGQASNMGYGNQFGVGLPAYNAGSNSGYQDEQQQQQQQWGGHWAPPSNGQHTADGQNHG